MQENRSFDSYFGTYPGADGFPHGTCVAIDPKRPQRGCVVPFHDQHDVNAGGPHSADAAQRDLNSGVNKAKMDGFVLEQTNSFSSKCRNDNPNCGGSQDGVDRHDTMGYHTADELPNYWSYAQHFVLQDRLFSGERSWSLPSHLDLVSEWVATCRNSQLASTCVTANNVPRRPGKHTNYPWVTLFQLMDVNHVTWKYYLGQGMEPDCADGEMTCAPQFQSGNVPSIWNPGPYFSWYKQFGQSYLNFHNPDVDQLLVDVKNGTLPQVSWVVPAQDYSEHPPGGVTAGMEYVTSLVNAVMTSAYWRNTAIFIAWDDWGGFYDHVDPPNVDRNSSSRPIEGFGLRVPGLMISAWARAGIIDHAALGIDSYATFIEDLFMGGARLDPKALNNPDIRPTIRDALTQVSFLNGATEPLGNLLDEFDFNQSPQAPLVLSTHIPTGLQSFCRHNPNDTGAQCQISTVTLTWNAVTGPQVPGPFTYHITRDGAELAQCKGSNTHCTDVPGKGAHFYRAYAVNSGNVASPLSAATEADEP